MSLSLDTAGAGGGEVSPPPVVALTAQETDIADWIALLKPRVMSLVVFTGAIGLVLAPGGINPVLGITAVLCIAVGAGACGAINMWYDRDIDALMHRTRNRPIPAGRMPPRAALGFGITLAAASVLLMFLAVNAIAAGILALSIGFYVFVYTMWLKRRTPQNIVIGGAAGAFPAVIGWAAVTGTVPLVPLLLFAIVFFWTPAHFWSLALYANADYTRAGVPMLPVVAGAKETRRQIMLYTLMLSVVSVLPWVVGFSGPVYGLTALVLDLGFLLCAWRVLADRQDPAGVSLTGDAPARAAFRYSLAYLFLLFAVLPIDRLAR